jgi:hypothetical protein
MDCDRVFMILTRGPFPTGEPWDEEVESHLETCADCWRLAEALRPALEVFQEAVPPAESRDLPGYWGDARPASVVMAGLASSATRAAVASSPKATQQGYRNYPNPPLVSEGSVDLIRAIALVATMSATAMALMLIF